MRNLRYFPSIKVARSKHSITISQIKYMLDLLKENGMIGCKPMNTPIDPNHKLGFNLDFNLERSLIDKGRYYRLVGKLIYLLHTKPVIAYTVSVVSQSIHLPIKCHMYVVQGILRYLKGYS